MNLIELSPLSNRFAPFRFWRQSFKAKLFVAFTGLWLVLSTTTGFIVYRIVSEGMEAKLGEQLLSIARLVGMELSGKLPELPQPKLPGSLSATLVPSLRRFLDAGVLQNITLLNTQGTVLMDATGEAVPGFKTFLLSDAQLDQLQQNKPVLLPIHSGDFGLLHQSAFIAISKDTILQVDANPKSLEVLNRFRNFSILLGLTGFLLSALVSALVAQTVLKPVGTMARLAHEVAQGQYSEEAHIPNRREDELGQLERSLLEMSSQIKDREEELSRLRRLAEEQAEQMKQVAAGIAHEVRSSLSVIRGEAEWMEKNTGNPSETQASLQKIHEKVSVLNYLVQRFLEYSGEFQLNRRFIEPAQLLEQLGKSLENQAKSQGVRIIDDFRPCGKVEADTTLLSNALYNLGLNGLQAMPRGGTLTLRLRTENASTVIEVEDTGAGITVEAFPRLFKPFYSNKPGGTGLGLAFAQKIIQSHGGRTEVFNRQDPNQGSPGGAVFRIVLPAVKGES